MGPVHALSDSLSLGLLLDATRAFREIAKLLKPKEGDRDLKHFCSRLMAHCFMARDHISRIKDSIAPSDRLVTRLLVLFESRITEAVDAPLNSSYPRLRTLIQHWNSIRMESEDVKIQTTRSLVNFGLRPEHRDEFLEGLEKWEDDLTREYPEDTSQWSKDDMSPKSMNTREPSYAVWNAAQSLFKTLTAHKNCTCQPSHEFRARLGLNTYRKADLDDHIDEDFDFDMFLSMQHDWQEVHVHTVKDRVVQFESVPKKLNYTPMKVKHLCEPIQKIKKLASHRLELKVERGRLWKLKSERCSFQVDRTKTQISLDQFIKEGSRSLTEKTKRILAVLLSYTVLHLQGTPWLQSSWGSSSIIFFRTTSSAIPLKPFIQVQLAQENLDDGIFTQHQGGKPKGEDYDANGEDMDDIDPDDVDPDDIDPDDLVLHHCPSVVTLAIMLMELYLATPFEVLAKKYGIDVPDGLQGPTISIDADLVFQECKSEIPENSQFRYAVEKCLDPKTWQDDEGRKLDPEALRTAIYQEIVRHLEDELSQAFSYISLDELDKIAQTLDFGSWGQTIQNQQGEITPSPSQSLELYRSPNDFRYVTVTEPFKNLQQFHKHEIWHPTAGHSVTLPNPNPIMSGHIDYKSSKFFDDETLSEDHPREACMKYMNWKRDFQKVYEKFVEKPLEHRPQTPIKIAILDTGVDLNHPDMDARDHQIKGKYNWTSERFKKMVHDNNGHGTHTAGLLLDYAPDAELYIAKIAETKPSSPEVIAKAIDFAVNTWQVEIISMSFGFPTSDIPGYPFLEQAIANAYSKNVLLFAAASNSGANLDRAYPARDQNVICIHSTDANGNRSQFSPTALSNDTNIATIGEAVESAWPVHLCDAEANPTFVKYKSGTSYATPIAAGIAAFLLQYAKLHLSGEQAKKMRRQARMKAIMRRIAQKSSESRGRDDYHYVALSLYSDNLFGKPEGLTRDTIVDVLNNS